MLALVLTALTAAPNVDVEGLLGEMMNRRAPLQAENANYTVKQASSYDRKSKEPNTPEWWANDDWSNFVRIDDVDGKKEYVLMDVSGPGAIVRFWITGFQYNRNIKFYLEGATTPTFQMPIDKAIGGDGFAPDPLSYESARGRNLYFPIPYAQSCKVTVDGAYARETGDFKDNLYYQINYRTYNAGTAVESLTPARLADAQDMILETAGRLESPESEPSTTTADAERTLAPGESAVLNLSGPAVINNFVVNLSGAADKLAAARQTIVRMEFDGVETVWAPVGDFFGAGFNEGIHTTWNRASSEGLYSSFWAMPFGKSAKITIENRGSASVPVSVYAGATAYAWNDNSLHFHAQWRMKSQRTKRATGTEDFTFCDIKGPGFYVGDNIVLRNADPAWWGEGDEKIFVDGEKFPSHFGTGTEDYYGYAWCTPEYFSKPFNAQPQASGPQNAGLVTNVRERSLDMIPFRSSLKFDMEIWHWVEADLDYASTALFYAKPGLNPAPQSLDAIKSPVWKPIPSGGYEIVELTGGQVVTQNLLSFGEHWDKNDQLWWTGGKPGDKLTIPFESSKEGRQVLELTTTMAPDYAIIRVYLNGQKIGDDLDLYNEKVIRQVHTYDSVDLKSGRNTLTFEIIGANTKAVQAYMFGLDTVSVK